MALILKLLCIIIYLHYDDYKKTAALIFSEMMYTPQKDMEYLQQREWCIHCSMNTFYIYITYMAQQNQPAGHHLYMKGPLRVQSKHGFLMTGRVQTAPESASL